MWVSKQTKKSKDNSGSARVGLVTAGGQESGVYLGTQRCWLPVMAPGGYRWRPGTGEQVLVLKTGVDGESACVLARQEEPGEELQPGEVEVYAPNCRVRLTGDGRVDVRGKVYVNGTALEDMVSQVVAAALAGQEG